MEKRLMTLLAGTFLFAGSMMAQTNVSGTVTSSEDGEPVVGAAVKVEGTNTGTVTDVDGHFQLNAPAGAKLVVSYLGMKPQTVKAGGNMKVVLQNDNHTLDEVMVVAFGQQTKNSFAGSAAVVNAEDLSKKIATNAADALVGTVPGLQITGGSGQPGADQGDIHIRGIASLNASTTPLIVVDGAPYPASLSNIPQEDIESITVLKDASSAALYGARGAAGVILITTKKGNIGKANIDFEAKWGGTSRAVQDYDVITDPKQYAEVYYSQLYNYAFYGNGLSAAAANKWVNANMFDNKQFGLGYNVFSVPAGESIIGLDGKINSKATVGSVYTGLNGQKYYLQPDNWKDAAYRHGFRQEYNFNVSGASDKLSYYSSVGYLKESGVLVNSGYERLTARFKADYQATKWLHLFSNVGWVHSNMNSNPNLSNTINNAANPAIYTQYIAPIYPLYVRGVDENGNPYIMKDEYGHRRYDFGSSSDYDGLKRGFMANANPIGSNQYDNNKNRGDQIQGQFNFDINITPWLKFSSNNNYTLGLTQYSIYGNPYIGAAASENGSIDKYNTVSRRQNYIQTLNYHQTFGQHDLQAMLGHEWYKSHSDLLEAWARGGFSPDIQEIAAFSDRYNSNSYATNYNVEGYFGNVLYNYAQRYFAQASYRRDASSRFAKNHRWGDFWSVGGAWIISKEKFFKELDATWVNNLKLKASVGQQGNDGIPDFEFIDRYSLSKGNKQMLPSFAQIGNDEITWETTTNFNLGLEFSLFDNRVNGEFNWYNKHTTNLLFWEQLPESNGVRGYYDNIGSIRNRGVELTLSADVIRTKDITWNVSGNISHNNAKILKLSPDKIANYGGWSQADVTNGFNVSMWYAEGGQLYNAMLPEYAGVNEKGEPLYWVDEDIYKQYKAGTLSNSSKPGTKHSFTTTDWNEASYYTRNMLPWANGGFSTTLSAYGFDVSANFDFQLGGKIYDFGYAELMTPSYSSNHIGYTYHKDILKAWTPNNTSSNIPRLQYGDQTVTSQSTRFLTSARYLNFQSFIVGYTLPRAIVNKLMLSKIRVYVQGQNLCFWSARKGLDPRFDFQGTTSLGIDSYAPVRTIMGGIQVSF